MKNKVIIFFLFILLLFIIFSRIEIISIIPGKTDVPDFVLENSHIEHFVKGEHQFSVDAKRIEIFKKKFFFYNASVSFNYGIKINADKMEIDMRNANLTAKDNVHLSSKRINYYGAEIIYYMKDKKFLGYHGGKIEVNRL